jgi:hypothetical protein
MSQVFSQSINAPKIIRTGMPDIEEYQCPPYPRWIEMPDGKRRLVQTPEDDPASAEKATKPSK